jgi:hypothetical protein
VDPAVIPWSASWVWSLPIIAATVIFHSFGFAIANQRVSLLLDGKKRLNNGISMLVVGGAALCATVLHGLEAAMWAVAYLLLGALPDRKSAMLYSLNAMTTYGHADLHLGTHWQLMGSLEALNGWILFGITTAFLFTVVQRVWPHIARTN